MYKKIVVRDGKKVEEDQYAVRFYAQNYAKEVGIKLEEEVCTSHLECGTRCCVKRYKNGSAVETDKKLYCQIINHDVNPLTKKCSEFEQEEIKENIILAIIVAVSVVLVVLILFKSHSVYNQI